MKFQSEFPGKKPHIDKQLAVFDILNGGHLQWQDNCRDILFEGVDCSDVFLGLVRVLVHSHVRG